MKEDEIIPVITHAHCRMEAFLHLNEIEMTKRKSCPKYSLSLYLCICYCTIILQQ